MSFSRSTLIIIVSDWQQDTDSDYNYAVIIILSFGYTEI